ncbi:hypothetical protein OAG94_01870 [bacterium]|nr:hypothetical protein [bacterium]
MGLESLFGSTGFDKMVDKDVRAEEIGEWGDIAKWRCDGGKVGEKIVHQTIQEELTIYFS